MHPTRLVCLPGSLGPLSSWQAVADRLASLVDPVFVDFGDADDIRQMASNILDAVGAAPFVLAGFSLGGYVALEMIRQSPKRVQGLILLDTTARPDAPENAPRRQANIEKFASHPRECLEAFVQIALGPNTPAEVEEHIRKTFYDNGPAMYVPQQVSMMTRPDARLHLASITCATLVICGAEDKATPPLLNQEIAESIAGATYVELPGVGHMTLVEAAPAVAEAIETFLNKALPRSHKPSTDHVTL